MCINVAFSLYIYTSLTAAMYVVVVAAFSCAPRSVLVAGVVGVGVLVEVPVELCGDKLVSWR